MGMDINLCRPLCTALLEEVMEHNKRFFPGGEEYRFMVYYQPGSFKIYEDIMPNEPQLTINVTQTSRYAPFVAPYLYGGMTTYISSVPQIPTRFLDPRIKNVSRLHYWLAEKEAEEWKNIGGWSWEREVAPILLDEHGYIAEGSGYNVGFFKDDRLFSPKHTNILNGITMKTCEQMNDTWEGDFAPYDLIQADSMFICSTFRGIIPSYRFIWRNKEYKLPNKHDSVNKLIDNFDCLVGVDTRKQWRDWYKRRKII
jgi:branched-subunit amino acid aminotransferase/4-amino-4-deoxychorismate lyase